MYDEESSLPERSEVVRSTFRATGVSRVAVFWRRETGKGA